MCGIHLILDKHQNLPSYEPVALEHMLDASSHRGPDHRSMLSLEHGSGRLHLASNRLKIIDPHQRANQPMQMYEGRYNLCFNGTIYNYFELRNQLLGEGVQFHTQSDTEVLLHMLVRQGKDALSKLNGMFTLAFYDAQEEKLLIARDRFGMKPLYYFQDENFLVFSSEARSLINSGMVRKQLRKEAIAEYLYFRYVRPPATFFEDIYQFPAGCFSEISNGGDVQPQSFVPEAEAREIPEAEVLQDVEERLTDAVLRHLVADVNCGLFLSGGVDSTLLLALIKVQGAHPVPTFSVVNSKEDASYGTQDYQYAARAAAMYGRKHYELTLSADMLPGHADRFINAIDQPVGDSAAFLTYLLSAEVKKVAGVALSGAGADELFGGYHRHRAFQQYLRHYRWLMKSEGMIRNVSKLLPVGFAHPLRKQFRLLSKLGNSLHKDPAHTFQHFISRQAFAAPGDVWPAAAGGEGADFETYWLDYALKHDLGHYLPQDVLMLSDNMSMARSLEMRMPYLDLALAGYAQQLPATLKLRHGRKWILKRLLEQKGGKIFCRRSKEGFGLPLGGWLRAEAGASLRSELQNREHLLFQYVDYKPVQRMLRAHMAKRQDHGIDLWNLWQLAAWMRLHFM